MISISKCLDHWGKKIKGGILENSKPLKACCRTLSPLGTGGWQTRLAMPGLHLIQCDRGQGRCENIELQALSRAHEVLRFLVVWFCRLLLLSFPSHPIFHSVSSMDVLFSLPQELLTPMKPWPLSSWLPQATEVWSQGPVRLPWSA